MKMTATMSGIGPPPHWLLAMALGVVPLAACGVGGDTGAIRSANALAIACDTDAALGALDVAEAGGGLAAELAALERVVFLEDVGRTEDARTALARRNVAAGADAQDIAEAEDAVAEALVDLRDAREAETGRRLCP